MIIILGGYDKRVKENIEHLIELCLLCESHQLQHTTIWSEEELSLGHGNPQVIFMPSVPNAIRDLLLQHSCCLIYTPRGEHFGIVPVEAMAAGTPVIAMDSGGPRETILDGETGFLCQDKAQRLAQEISEKMFLLLNDGNLTKKMGETARAHVSKSFSIHAFADTLEQHLVRLFK